jgi:two-component system sensor histidine kinase UhpB
MPGLRGLLPGLLLIAILPLTLLLIVVAIGATTLHQNEMRALVAEHNQQTAREAAAGLDERVRHLTSSLRAMADTAADGLTPDAALRNMRHVLSDFDGGVAVLDASGSVFTSTLRSLDPADLRTALKDAEAGAARLSFHASGDVLASARSATGAIVAVGQFSTQSLRLSALADRFQPPKARVLVVNDAARVVYDSNGYRTGTDASSEPGVVEALRGESGVTFTPGEADVERVVAYEPLHSAGWGLIISEPWEEVINPLLRTSLLIPLALIPAVLITLAAMIFGARRVIRPLQQLDRQAARVGRGDYGALAQPIDGIAEIQTLQATLAEMASQIRSYQRSVQLYAAAITRSQEDERARLARELHDETVQSLVALHQRVQMVERALARDPQTAAGKLAELRAMTADALEDVRRAIRALRPIYLEDLGLAPALEALVRGIGAENSLEATFVVEGVTRRLAPERELAVYRIVQEALHNIVRHAQARRVQAIVRFDEVLAVSVIDDGVGFSVPDRMDALTESRHVGLIGMRERAELIGARLAIRSAPGQGTTVELYLPL